MTTKDFEALKDYILAKNAYFSEGYANAFTDTETSAVYARVDNNLKVIFPDDRVGNYFYLRNDPNFKFTSKVGYQECGIGKLNFDDSLNVFLIAIVNDADDYDLINQLRNTCLSFKDLIIIPTGAMWQRENVLINEMAGFGEDAIMEGLKNLKNQTIIRLQLTISKEYIPNNCFIDPCKKC